MIIKHLLLIILYDINNQSEIQYGLHDIKVSLLIQLKHHNTLVIRVLKDPHSDR